MRSPMTTQEKTDPGIKIKIHQIKKAILKKAYQVVSSQPDLPEEKSMAKLEAETAKLFEQLLNVQKSLPVTDMPELKNKALGKKRASHRDRTEHVGRFFIHTLEKQLREAGVQECVIPVFAKSVPMLIGDEAYNKFAGKIDHLIAFATSKGFSYDQILTSKPGKEVMQGIVQLYRSEMETTPGFEEKLRNRLDEALVQFSDSRPDEDYNIEDAIEQSYNAFIKLLNKNE